MVYMSRKRDRDASCGLPPTKRSVFTAQHPVGGFMRKNLRAADWRIWYIASPPHITSL